MSRWFQSIEGYREKKEHTIDWRKGLDEDTAILLEAIPAFAATATGVEPVRGLIGVVAAEEEEEGAGGVLGLDNGGLLLLLLLLLFREGFS